MIFDDPQAEWKNGGPVHNTALPNDRPRQPLVPKFDPSDSNNNGQ
jgi:hypothetical protein